MNTLLEDILFSVGVNSMTSDVKCASVAVGHPSWRETRRET